ncbi:hypothetical protein SAMN05192588_2249 [Nonlabens sp. Hel1_33_55]|uniref:hypothetical protein n=1 Tax=Nonlabens sp. Hel1_33_55 TaxID=1336802 RepID=UPI000875C4AE|nr:hypothetical protein [Nonlabens sp. Hel1_33_55]SCY32241.1 hypothetical protein SAMN05192588_2249 [Nonlabens sp. Hel1_33_55]
MIKQLSYILFFLAAIPAIAQTASNVTTKVDRDSIMMGEEIKLQITVDATPEDLVIFPIQQAVGVLEVIEDYPVDTIRENDKYQLFKQYGITQFDSGDYYVPRLKLFINNKEQFTDSLLVKVREVQTDTTVQGMYDIKADIPNDYERPFNWKGLLLLLLWIPLGILFWWLSRKRTQKTYEQTLPPYEWSKYRLNKLAESNLVEDRAWKTYYTELSYIVRRYIDNKVYGHAMESTTAELIQNIENETAAKGVSITDKTKQRLQAVLQKADLIKFAGMSGDGISAKEDREAINDIIYNIHQVLPPPSEEELLLDVKYRKEQARKAKIRKVLMYVLGVILGLAIAIAAWIVIVGYDNVRDQILGNELREYYEGERLTSRYGVPEITLTTPEILERRQDLPVSDQFKAAMASMDAFALNTIEDDLFVIATTFQLSGEGLPEGQEIPQEMVTEPIYQSLEQQGATNILMLDEPIERNGLKGIKLNGTFESDGDTYDYEAQVYVNGGSIQQILVAVVQDDAGLEPEKEYGRLLKEQIISSIQLNQPQTAKEDQE